MALDCNFDYSRVRPTVLALGAGCACFGHFFSRLSSFPLCLGDGSIQTEILSQGAVKPKTTNRQIIMMLLVQTGIAFILVSVIHYKSYNLCV